VTKRAREVFERFGIPKDAFARLQALEDQETVFIGTPEAMGFDAVRPMRRGIRLARIYPYSLKPTTFGMQVLGRLATRNVIELSEEQTKQLINGGSLSVEADVENGFVLLKWQGFAVGVGFYKRPALKSQIPRFRPVE
jgi:NOL1/NOP2/fmu family ribosome biogenesis protein